MKGLLEKYVCDYISLVYIGLFTLNISQVLEYRKRWAIFTNLVERYSYLKTDKKNFDVLIQSIKSST
jgi:hypothetical protein